MKKIVAFFCSIFLTFGLFAQANRKLISAVYDFATVPSETWTLYETNFNSIDPIGDKYSFTGAFVIKNIIGLAKYDFTCNITKEGEDFNVQLTNMSTYACDRNLKIVSKGSVYKVSSRVADEYAKQMKTEIISRLSSWSEEQYNEKLDTALTSPVVLYSMANSSALLFKKFINDNQIVGKKINVIINVTNVDEAPSYAQGYSYYVAGKTLCGFKKDSLGIPLPEYASVMVYTNNDSVISLTPADTLDGFIGGKSGSVYEVKGTIRDVSRKEIGGLSVIQINE